MVLIACWTSVCFFYSYCEALENHTETADEYTRHSKKYKLALSHLFRSFRFMRLIGFVPQLQSMMHAFFFAVSSVFWVLTLVLLFLYVTAVLATDFLGGQALGCEEDNGRGTQAWACKIADSYTFGTVLQVPYVHHPNALRRREHIPSSHV